MNSLNSGNNLTSINSTFCSGNSLANTNGLLTCQNGIVPSYNLPGGSWSQTCGPILLTSGIFLARCALPSSAMSYINLNLVAAGNAFEYASLRPSNGRVQAIDDGLTYIRVTKKYAMTKQMPEMLQPDYPCCPHLVRDQPSPAAPFFSPLAGATMINRNGVLVPSAVVAGLPAGSWYQSCSPISYSDSLLKAFCGRISRQGQPIVSMLNTTLCASSSSGVFNNFGFLACGTASQWSLPGMYVLAIFARELMLLLS